jgi:riboflavin biosynthesis pyrimidine reductase
MLTVDRRLETATLEPLVTAPSTPGRVRGGDLPATLRARYGSELSIPLRADRPTTIVNFVSTLDGVISYNTPEAAGGGEISGHFEPDRFVMGLLRALADVVLVGAGTVRAAPDGAWTPRSVHPNSDAEFGDLRAQLGLRPNPITAIVTGSGAIDLAHPGLSDPAIDVMVITTDAGEAILRRQTVSEHIQIHSAGAFVEAPAVVAAMASRDAELILCEGGPHLLGQLIGADLVDELFLTIAPQLAGRSRSIARLSLVEGTAFNVADAPWARLADLRRAGDHLFARYRLTEGNDQ